MPVSRHRKKKHHARHSGWDERVGMIRQVARFPLRECLINEDWAEHKLATISFARNRPDGGVAVGAFVVDVGCLGVKSAFANPSITAEQYKQRLVFGQPTNQIPFGAPCGVKLILGALEYARDLGFKPDPDYSYAREIFGDIDPADCEETFEYGMDGKPFYVAGPHDDPNRIVNQLTKKLGPDGYRFMMPLGDGDAEDLF
ncbi:MAG TPA: hypothetical protein VI837_10605 [Blastocatellia bacterium]|nr:hypothetical protein [Blastocatellia bacterium]